MEKHNGTETVWTKYLIPNEGLSAKRAKSGAFTIKVAKLAKAFMVDSTKSQANSEPSFSDFLWMTGPAP